MAMAIAGMVLSQPAMVTSPSNMWPRATSSTESAMISRLTREVFIPSVPVVMPSLIATVLTSSGVPPAAAMPSATRAARARCVKLHGIVPIQQCAIPICGRDRVSSVKPAAFISARATTRSEPSSSARLCLRGSTVMLRPPWAASLLLANLLKRSAYWSGNWCTSSVLFLMLSPEAADLQAEWLSLLDKRQAGLAINRPERRSGWSCWRGCRYPVVSGASRETSHNAVGFDGFLHHALENAVGEPG